MGIISSAKAAVDCTMFIMNMLFFLGGGSVLALGAYMVSSSQWAAVYGSGIKTYAYYVLAFGAITVLTAFCGCCGAKRRSRPLLLVYAVVLIIMLAAQGFALYFLYERFWGDIPEECVRKGLSFNTTGIDLIRPSDSFGSDEKVDCSKIIDDKFRITAYILWQKLYRDYLLYNSNPVKFAEFKTNARIATEISNRGK